jgi:hypothetical protein
MGVLKEYFLVNGNNALLNGRVERLFLGNGNNALLKWVHWLNYFLFFFT